MAKVIELKSLDTNVIHAILSEMVNEEVYFHIKLKETPEINRNMIDAAVR